MLDENQTSGPRNRGEGIRLPETAASSVPGGAPSPAHVPALSVMSSPRRSWRERLREAHVRVTSQRLAVLHTLDAHPHSTAAEIVGFVDAKEMDALTVQGAYVMLQQLEAATFVRRVNLPDSASVHWETRVGDNHHHVQCVMCGRIEDVDCVVGKAPCLTPADTHGMRILEAQIVFRGICESCAGRLKDDAGDAGADGVAVASSPSESGTDRPARAGLQTTAGARPS